MVGAPADVGGGARLARHLNNKIKCARLWAARLPLMPLLLAAERSAATRGWPRARAAVGRTADPTHDERTIMEVWRFGHFLTSPRHARRSATSLRVPIVHTNSQEPPE